MITEGTAASASKSTGTKDSVTSPVSPFAKTGSSKKTTTTTAGDNENDEAGRADEDEPTGANDAQERQSDDDGEEGEEMTSVNNNAAADAEEDDSAATDVNARQVSREEAEGYAREAGGLLFFEASAKTGKGVQEIFTEIGQFPVPRAYACQNPYSSPLASPHSQKLAHGLDCAKDDDNGRSGWFSSCGRSEWDWVGCQQGQFGGTRAKGQGGMLLSWKAARVCGAV